jgi:hypothetical protein
MRTFQQILEAAGYETSAYSGRGMAGTECVSAGLPGDGRLGRLFADVTEAMGADENKLVAAAFRRMRTDSIGLSSVVYFPGIAHE